MAKNSERDSDLDIDEIKASLLLCIHGMSESLNWEIVAEIARISRMAELYYTLKHEKDHEDTIILASGDETLSVSQESLEHETDKYRDTEDWKSVWWCIYSLDTICSALASSSTATASSLQGRVELPAVSIPDFTNSLSGDSSTPKDKLQLIPCTGVKHWEIMRMIYSENPCSSRNLYFGASNLMRSVTDLRSLSNRGHCKDLHKRLQELESDCTATSFALPPWFFNATRNLVLAETEEEHQRRMDTLLVWFGTSSHRYPQVVEGYTENADSGL
ncbi:hypothetical protein F25303_4815 [Fusarium sp. NRRL 25303]|nr:hypothetical protein F25303_4815 [Fusarium sp. NRRL 25303]